MLFVSDPALICFKSFSIIAAKPVLAFGPMPNYAVADLKTQTCYLSTWGSSATPLSQLMNNQLFRIITIAPLLKIQNFMKGLGKQNHHCSISMFNFFPMLLLLLLNNSATFENYKKVSGNKIIRHVYVCKLWFQILYNAESIDSIDGIQNLYSISYSILEDFAEVFSHWILKQKVYF